jgi:hypothetical protein
MHHIQLHTTNCTLYCQTAELHQTANCKQLQGTAEMAAAEVLQSFHCSLP